jgi:hypothetical protein
MVSTGRLRTDVTQAAAATAISMPGQPGRKVFRP